MNEFIEFRGGEVALILEAIDAVINHSLFNEPSDWKLRLIQRDLQFRERELIPVLYVSRQSVLLTDNVKHEQLLEVASDLKAKLPYDPDEMRRDSIRKILTKAAYVDVVTVVNTVYLERCKKYLRYHTNMNKKGDTTSSWYISAPSLANALGLDYRDRQFEVLLERTLGDDRQLVNVKSNDGREAALSFEDSIKVIKRCEHNYNLISDLVELALLEGELKDD